MFDRVLNPIKEGGGREEGGGEQKGKKTFATSFSHITPPNVALSPARLSHFYFSLFYNTVVKFQVHT